MDFLRFFLNNKPTLSEISYIIDISCFYPHRVCIFLRDFFTENEMDSWADFFDDFANSFENIEIVHKYKEINCPNENVAFIISVNNDEMFNEAKHYIDNLFIPPNMKVEVYPIRGASSMTEAYNQGMMLSKAKYKVYLHQDVFIINHYFLYDICKIFSNTDVGLIGIAGVEHLPQSGIWWENDGNGDYRNLYQDLVIDKGHTIHNPFEELYKEVEVVDGALLVTQYDIPWREDIFKGWHYYDISQCMEFKKNNYKVVVAGQQSGVWCLHEQKWNKCIGSAFYNDCKIFLDEYRKL